MAKATRDFGPLVGAIDQGTSSTRFLVFASKTSELLSYHQVELKQCFPKEGWCEEDPKEILATCYECIDKTVQNLRDMSIDPANIKSIGITNQRETTVVWDKKTGEPLHPAVVWLDTRTGPTVDQLVNKVPGKNKEHLQPLCGLPLSTYFSAVKLRWLMDNVDDVKTAVDENRCCFGTVDSWLMWFEPLNRFSLYTTLPGGNFTGGVNGGLHITDVTNASRTMLMNIQTQTWDDKLCSFFEIPKTVLPEIRSSAEVYGSLNKGALAGVPLAGILGDQQAALVGQTCFKQGMAKNTYGTGCFLLYNTGEEPIFSKNGLLTTVAYKLGKDAPVVYALEGSIATAGAAVRWLRDNLGIIKEAKDIEPLAASVENTGGVYFVPAFSGLYAPYWQTDARGVVCGLTQYTTKAHIARAVLEAVCWQTKELLDAMNQDSGIPLTQLQVDGGMTANGLLMQLQADIVNLKVVRPSMPETTALGAAMAAGHAVGVWSLKLEDLTAITTDTFAPAIKEEAVNVRYDKWKLAIQKSMHWEGHGADPAQGLLVSIHGSIPASVFLLTSMGLLILARHLSAT